jgi:hypothetical protein
MTSGAGLSRNRVEIWRFGIIHSNGHPTRSFQPGEVRPLTHYTEFTRSRFRVKARRLGLAASVGALLLLCLYFVIPERGDALRDYRLKYPETLDWKDRRPIGTLFLARDNTKWRSNPRGWFNDPNIDVFSSRGLSEFRQQVMAYADQSVALMKEMNAQGMIVWDLEGQQFPHPRASYVGDPTQLARIAPEMELCADEFFARFTSQGFRVGVCIRPQKIVFRSDGSFSQQEFVLDSQAIFNELDRKIAYARTRWNCSLFYVDSNFGFWNLGLYDATIFEKLQKKYPTILLIPEHQDRRYFAYTAPYYDVWGREKWPGTRSTAKEHRQVYPGAFSVINVMNSTEEEAAGLRSDLIQAVRSGDILMYSTWWRCPEFNVIASIYKEGVGDGGPVVNPDIYEIRPGEDRILDVLRTDFSLIFSRPLKLIGVTAPRFGSVQIENSRLHYFAPSEPIGDDEFQYTVSDGVKTASASVIVSVRR